MDVIRKHPEPEQHTRPPATSATLGLIIGIALVASSACTGVDGAPEAKSPARGATSATPTITQPVVRDLSVAPEAARVDLTMPTFTNPTEVTNPLFPVSDQRSVLMLGTVDGSPFRTEVTLLPETRIIGWNGTGVETLVSQYTAFLDGRIHEVAYDYYAQDDRGAVWYFGEDVFNFADGAIADTHGTWLAGKDGPAAMIMPARPRVGDVYRPENIPGFVFEEVTVRSVGRTLNGPMGPIEGGLLIEELHMDGKTEAKTFAPGYGEFRTAGGGDVEALSLAVPTDAMDASVPPELSALYAGATRVFDAAGSGRWHETAAVAEEMAAAWRGLDKGQTPDGIDSRMESSLGDLDAAAASLDAKGVQQAAIDVARSSLDLQLPHRPRVEIDRARFALWARQLQVDAAANDAANVSGDLFTLDYISERIVGAMTPAEVTRLHTAMEAMQSAIADGDLDAASGTAATLTR